MMLNKVFKDFEDVKSYLTGVADSQLAYDLLVAADGLNTIIDTMHRFPATQEALALTVAALNEAATRLQKGSK